jgi:hypothetical protein
MTDSMHASREGESKTPLTHAVPPSLTYRAAEYTSLPPNAAAWMHRHRDQPSIFRRAIYLFNRYQALQIGELFPPGWKADPGHSLLSCVGTLRFGQMHTKEGTEGAATSAALTPVSSAARRQPVQRALFESRRSRHTCTADTTDRLRCAVCPLRTSAARSARRRSARRSTAR